MAITMTVKKGGGGGDFQPGWKEVTANKAKYGTLENGSKYIDVWFENYSDNFNLRMYAKTSKAGEEFAIANLFRFANAGITEVVDGSKDGETVVKIDDTATNLVGKSFWIYLYKNEEGYSRVLQRIAPVEFEGTLDTFTENDVNYWKGRAEKYFIEWVAPNIGSSVTDKIEGNEDMPF
tara:strand:+ start:156 stop:689 length:534 start_codon:yes stop_codon:yes gene_type:complete